MVTPLLLLFLSSVLPGGFYSLIIFFPVLFFKYFFWLALFSAAQTHNTSTTVTSAPPTARGQFSKDWQLINMVLTRRWDGARGLPTFISFSYDLEVHPCRVTSRRERIVRSVWGRRSSKISDFFFFWQIDVSPFFPHASPSMLHAKQKEQCAHRKREVSFKRIKRGKVGWPLYALDIRTWKLRQHAVSVFKLLPICRKTEKSQLGYRRCWGFSPRKEILRWNGSQVKSCQDSVTALLTSYTAWASQPVCSYRLKK